VACVYCREGKIKLANLVTWLKAKAYSFYSTCPVQQRSETAALTEHFKPAFVSSQYTVDYFMNSSKDHQRV